MSLLVSCSLFPNCFVSNLVVITRTLVHSSVYMLTLRRHLEVSSLVWAIDVLAICHHLSFWVFWIPSIVFEIKFRIAINLTTGA